MGAYECSTDPVEDTCIEGRTLTIGTAVSEEVTPGDCQVDGRAVDSYAFSVAAQSIVRFEVNASTESDIRIRRPQGSGPEVALHANGLAQYSTYVVLAPGEYILDIGADDESSGNYTVTPTLLDAMPAGCLTPPANWVFSTIDVDVAGAITNTDCGGTNGFRFDPYNVFLVGGERTITVTSVGMGSNIEIKPMNTPGAPLKTQARNTAGVNSTTFGAASAGYYMISVINLPANATGTYTISIQ
jgi:hypothetical protein